MKSKCYTISQSLPVQTFLAIHLSKVASPFLLVPHYTLSVVVA